MNVDEGANCPSLPAFDIRPYDRCSDVKGRRGSGGSNLKLNMSRRAEAIVDVAMIEDNARSLISRLGATTQLCAVVKANGYGHGVIESARAAIAGGATWLAVATAVEAADLRAEVSDAPIIVLGPLDDDDLALAIEAKADLVAWTPSFVRRVSAARAPQDSRVHIKVDTGMGRWGVRGASAAFELAALIDNSPSVELTGVMTHFANADDVESDFFAEQLAAFKIVVDGLRELYPNVMIHAANSAATLRDVDAHFDMVRCGIAMYGLDPFQRDPREWQLNPALELRSYVAKVTRMEPGESVGYGRAFKVADPTYVATVPIGYADGVRRTLDRSIDVLIAGERYAVVGRVSMDCLAVDLGSTTNVRVGDEVVLIGASGSERILAEEVAKKWSTINYEVVCSLNARVERSYLGR